MMGKVAALIAASNDASHAAGQPPAGSRLLLLRGAPDVAVQHLLGEAAAEHTERGHWRLIGLDAATGDLPRLNYSSLA
jgi:hypothetical protein